MCDINLKYQLFIRHRTYDLLRLFMYKVLNKYIFIESPGSHLGNITYMIREASIAKE